MTEIVKVQIPLMTNDPAMPALIYDKNRKRMTQQKLDHYTLKAMRGDVKAFFEAEWQQLTGQWSISNRVKDRSW